MTQQRTRMRMTQGRLRGRVKGGGAVEQRARDSEGTVRNGRIGQVKTECALEVWKLVRRVRVSRPRRACRESGRCVNCEAGDREGG